MSFKELVHDIAHLAIVEMYTPKFEESLDFFTRILGLNVTEQADGVAYLRAYEDRYHHSLKLTAHHEAGVGKICWRTMSPQALERRVAELEAQGHKGKWIEDNKGYGRAYEFTTSGHRFQLFWEVEHYKAEGDQKSRLLSRASKRPDRGVPVRRLDHLNLMTATPASDAQILQETLGFRKTERAVMGETELACWLSTNPLVHEVAFTIDQHGGGNGRLHHLAFGYANPGQMLDIADLLTEEDIHIEAGPARHGISQAYFIYLYEPGGNRIELFGDQGYLIFDPEWETLTWDEDSFWRDGAIWIGGELPQDFFIYGTPIVEEAVQALKVAKGEAVPETEAAE